VGRILHLLFSMLLSASKRKECKKAFTLVELMIALVIFAIVIASGFACVKMGLTLVDNSRHHTRAGQIMQSEIERIRSLPWGSSIEPGTLLALPTAETAITLNDEYAQANYANYELKRTITNGVGDSRKITLVVTWTDIGRMTHAKTYVTLYTKGGLYDYIQ